jgi:transposase
MTSIEGFEGDIERVDDIPLLFGLLQQMGTQSILDKGIQPHGNWQGLSPGWVVTVWLIHILSEQNHLMEPVQMWVQEHLTTLRRLTGQAVEGLDFTDDRLALCLEYIYDKATWQAIEADLGTRLIRIYDLDTSVLRLDATVGTVQHEPGQQHKLFKVGKAKNGLYETQFKMMLASLDPLGLTLVVDVLPGNQADDPLYVPSYERAKTILKRTGVLVVGDSKMSALATRATIVAGQDHYLTPLADLKDEPGLLTELLKPWQGREAEATRIFLPEDIPADGREADPKQALAYGFEVSRPRQATVKGRTITWEERLLVIRSFSYVQTMQASLRRHVEQAEAELRDLTPTRQRGKRQIQDEASLLAAIAQIEKKYRVQGLFDIGYQSEVEERSLRAYQDKPARVERTVRYHVNVKRNEAAIATAEFQAGWRIYATNAPVDKLALTQAVLAYREQYIEENVFRRLQGKFLSITPLYIQRDDHAEGLFHLLTIGARVLALGDYLAQQALAKENAVLTGVYAGNSKRGTARPTTERMLKAFEGINLLIIPSAAQASYYLTRLSSAQERILALLGLSRSLYTALQTG